MASSPLHESRAFVGFLILNAKPFAFLIGSIIALLAVVSSVLTGIAEAFPFLQVEMDRYRSIYLHLDTSSEGERYSCTDFSYKRAAKKGLLWILLEMFASGKFNLIIFIKTLFPMTFTVCH